MRRRVLHPGSGKIRAEVESYALPRIFGSVRGRRSLTGPPPERKEEVSMAQHSHPRAAWRRARKQNTFFGGAAVLAAGIPGGQADRSVL